MKKMNGRSGFTSRPKTNMPRFVATSSAASNPTRAPLSMIPIQPVIAAMPIPASAGHTRAAASVGPATENDAARSQ